MGCSQSNVQTQVIAPVEEKPKSVVISRQRPSNQQSNRILENCVVVWFLPDSKVDVGNERTKLRHVVSLVKIFDDASECTTYITRIRVEKIFLIMPTMDSLLQSIQCLPQIEKIYIFDPTFRQNEKYENQLLSSNTFYDIELLCKQLQTDVELCELDLIDIVSFAVSMENESSSDECKKQEAAFLYLQLMREILFRLKFENNAKDEFVNFLRTNYADNDEQIRLIDHFDTNYRPQQALRWLMRKCFIWKIFQRVQRTHELDIHYKLGFIQKQINTQLKVFQENNSSNTENTWIVYYGKTMLHDRFDAMVRHNCGGLLSFSSYFTTYTDKKVAVDFVCYRLLAHPNVTGILFEIHLDSTKRSTRSPFASLDEIDSNETNENNGIFFSMYTVFRIESVKQIIENSITMWTVKLTLVVDDDPQLLRIVSPLRSTEVNANPISYLGKLCMDKGDYEQAERFFLGMLQDPSILNTPYRLARVQKGLGANYTNKHEYDKALEYYEQALKTSLNFLSPEHTDLVPLYDGIGNSYHKQGDYIKALENYVKAANLLEHSKQPLNEQSLNDLNSRINNIKKLLITKQSF